MFIKFQDDENVEELDKLRSHPGTSGEHVIDLTKQLEVSLKKLHDTNRHPKSHEERTEKPAKVRGIKTFSSKCN